MNVYALKLNMLLDKLEEWCDTFDLSSLSSVFFFFDTYL